MLIRSDNLSAERVKNLKVFLIRNRVKRDKFYLSLKYIDCVDLRKPAMKTYLTKEQILERVKLFPKSLITSLEKKLRSG